MPGITAGINRIEERLTTDPAILKQADANQSQYQCQCNAQSNQEGGIPLIFLGFWLCRRHDFDQYIRAVFGSIATAGGIVTLGTVFGAGLLSSIFVAFIVFYSCYLRWRWWSWGRRRVVFLPGGGFGGGAVLAVVDLVAAVAALAAAALVAIGNQ